MKRENTSSLVRTQRSDRTSAHFFGLIDTLVRAVEPTQTQLDALESSYKSTGEFLVAAPEFQGLLLEIHGHGSRQLGTLVRPLDETREGFDVDQIARFHQSAMKRYGGAAGPGLLLGDLHTVVSRYAKQHGLKVHRWERCVTLEYSGGMCADIAPVIDDPLIAGTFGDTHARIPDRELRRYDSTNPRGYNRFFDKSAATSAVFTGALRFAKALTADAAANVTPLPSVQEVFDRLLCRLIQVLKLHRNVAFGPSTSGPDASPTSVFITTLAAKAYQVQAPLPHDSPLDLLLDIVETLPDHFESIEQLDGSTFWHLQNPSAPTDNLAAGMNTRPRQQGFAWWHARIVRHLTEILDAIENHAGMDVVLAAIKEAFGERAARAIQAEQNQHRLASRSVGRIALIPAAGIPLQAAARSHTFFGGP
jgi:hypothetical protein